MKTTTQSLTLEEFLQLPETKPASEYIKGQIFQKPMPKSRHSRLQGRLMRAINEVVEDIKYAYAFPELRCTVGGRSIVPDLTVLLWHNIRFNKDGEPIDNVQIAPDWTIEILSPDQSQTKVTKNTLHCLKYETQMGWLIDLDEQTVFVYLPEQQTEVFEESGEQIIVPSFASELRLTVGDLFDWLLD